MSNGKSLNTGCVTSTVTPLMQYYCSKKVTVEVTHPVDDEAKVVPIKSVYLGDKKPEMSPFQQ